MNPNRKPLIISLLGGHRSRIFETMVGITRTSRIRVGIMHSVEYENFSLFKKYLEEFGYHKGIETFYMRLLEIHMQMENIYSADNYDVILQHNNPIVYMRTLLAISPTCRTRVILMRYNNAVGNYSGKSRRVNVFCMECEDAVFPKPVIHLPHISNKDWKCILYDVEKHCKYILQSPNPANRIEKLEKIIQSEFLCPC